MKLKTLRISVDQISEYSYLEFGERGENAVTEVILDFASWAEEFGEGIVNLYVKRGGDTSAYPVPLSVDGTVATWIVSETDTYKRGRGEAEYVYVVGEQVEKTAVFGFYVRRDIGQPATTPPSPYETWLETLMELSNVTLKNAQDAENAAGEAAESADKAETAVSHYPVIVDNYWYVWRVEEEAYVNTGVKAEGEDFTIKGTVATVADLPSEAKQGDFWNVGTEAPYTMYMYQVGEGWINQGTLQGPTGTTFTPSVSEAGIISWTNDGGKPNPTARNIRGPQGIQGEKGDTGDAAGFGTPVASADQTIGQASVSVTASGPNTAKVFDFKFSGIKGENGEVGPTGTTFTPQVSSAGVISWTNDGGKQNPESVNIKGPQGEQGVKGDTGAAAGFGTPTASATQTIGEATVEVTATGPDTAKVFDFKFSGIKGEKGDKGDKGDTGEVSQAEFDELSQEVADQKSAIEALDSLVDRKAGMLVDTASGAIASFVPDATIDNLLGVTVDIKPVQDLHGQDAPYPPGGGKNKFNGTFLQGYWAYANGTWGDSNYWIATEKIPCKPSTSYTVSADAKLTRWQGFVWYDANGDYISTDNQQSNENIGLTKTSPSNAYYLAFNIAGYPGTTSTIAPSAVTHFQLEEGPSPTDYAPYENICPISGWTGAKIKATGINHLVVTPDLLSIPPYYSAGWSGTTMVDDNTMQVSRTNVQGGMGGIRIKSVPAGTYTFTCKLPITNDIKRFQWGYYTLNGRYSGQISGSSFDAKTVAGIRTITVPEDCDEIFIKIYANAASDAPLIVSQMQFEVGDTASDFKPYAGNTYPISWETEAGAVYGGTLDATNGTLTVKYVKNSIPIFSGKWGAVPNGYAVYRTMYDTTNNLNGVEAAPYMKSNRFKFEYKGRQDASLFSYGGENGATPSQTFILPASITSLEEANAWLTENPIEATFKLATPIVIQLDPVAIATIAEQTNNVWADAGDVSVEFAADLKHYIDSKIAAAVAALS